MPTYQYRCLDCSNELEAVQKFTDDPLTTCPTCQGTLRKVFSAVGVVFKGSGFYATDNRSKAATAAAPAGDSAASGKGAAPAKSTAAATSTAPAASGGDAKPATKPKKPAAGSPAA
ncbi:FmdB family zinc ribbon protein [Micropruina sp.]|uniref:FmdB family zinc ribbon protein n=1 Tax=Micropruina sp. TaxID=2737536 RepID=UPI0039E2C3C6